jgi:alanine racemase
MKTTKNKYIKNIKNKTKQNKTKKCSYLIPDDTKDITAIIDANKLRKNIKYLKKKAGTDVMPILKANAYGHGMSGIAKICRNAGVKYIGVATIGEALMLRENGDNGRILAWLYDINNPGLKKAISLGIDIAIIDDNHISHIEKLIPANKKCKVHLFVDTGINRASVPYSKAIHVAKILSENKKFELVGLMSHLVESQYQDDKIVNKQLSMFRKLRKDLEKHNIEPELVHIANSGGILNYDVSDFTLARSGYAFYGYDDKPNKNLYPAIKLVSPIIQLKYISKGDGVGYDRKYVAPKNMRIAIVPIGYADGLPNNGPNKLNVYVNGSKRKILGLESMDQIVIEAKPGDKLSQEVVIFGGDKSQSIYDIAKDANTNGYNMLVHLGNRIKYKYINV